MENRLSDFNYFWLLRSSPLGNFFEMMTKWCLVSNSPPSLSGICMTFFIQWWGIPHLWWYIFLWVYAWFFAGIFAVFFTGIFMVFHGCIQFFAVICVGIFHIFMGVFMVFHWCVPVCFTFSRFFAGVFTVFLQAYPWFFMGVFLFVLHFRSFSRAYSWFFMGVFPFVLHIHGFSQEFFYFPYESQTARNLSTFLPLKQCPDICGFDIRDIFQECIACE